MCCGINLANVNRRAHTLQLCTHFIPYWLKCVTVSTPRSIKLQLNTSLYYTAEMTQKVKIVTLSQFKLIILCSLYLYQPKFILSEFIKPVKVNCCELLNRNLSKTQSYINHLLLIKLLHISWHHSNDRQKRYKKFPFNQQENILHLYATYKKSAITIPASITFFIVVVLSRIL